MKICDIFLPEDLLLEVLYFLPVKSLLRFKCVSKSWYDLLVNPDNNILKDRRRLIIGHHILPNEGGDFRILSYDNLNVIEKDFRFSRFPFYHWSMYHPRLMGSYNGLVCFANYCLTLIALWNPTTRQSKLIRRYDDIYPPHQQTEHAFGYDFKRNDYRVMKFSPSTKDPHHKCEAEVYSFNTDTWTNSDAVIPDGIIFDNYVARPTICVKGVYSTMAYTKSRESGERTYLLFTIDMSNQEFILTPMPQAKYFKAYDLRIKVLIELHESVAFMRYEEETCSVFILNDYGPKGAWKLLHTIPLDYNRYPVGSWKNEILFDLGCHNDLISLNPTTHETKSLGVNHGYYKQVLEYTESLAWVDDNYRRFRKEDKASSLP